MLTENESRVLELIETGQDELIANLQRMIRFQTVTPPMRGRAETADYRQHQQFIRSLLDGLGMETEMWEVNAASLEDGPGRGVIPERDMGNMPVVVGRLPAAGAGKSLLLNGHYDVVPPGDTAGWRFEPFGAAIDNGRIYGRGAADMKGGNAAMLFAVQAIQRAGLTLQGEVTVQIVPDEEATCMGTLACVQRGCAADAALIPEPTGMQILVAMRGSVYGRITVVGRAGHAEMVQPHWSQGGAVNAISKAAKVIQALEDLADEWRQRPDRQHALIGPDSVLPTVIQGGEWEVTYPEKVEIRFGAMVAPGRKNPIGEIQDRLERLAASDPWMAAHPPALTSGPFYYGAEVSPEEAIVQTAAQSLRDLGIQPRLRGFGSLTDAIHLINLAAIPAISIGPDMDTIHGTDEFISIHQLVETARAIALVIMRWCGVR